MVTTKIKETTTTLRFLLAHNSHNPSFGRTKYLFIQKKQTNCYLIAVTLRLRLRSQVTCAHFVSTRVIFPLLFPIASKYLQYWLAFETLDWLSGAKLSCHVYFLMMLLHLLPLDKNSWTLVHEILYRLSMLLDISFTFPTDIFYWVSLPLD
jgi:hypothetical protein